MLSWNQKYPGKEYFAFELGQKISRAINKAEYNTIPTTLVHFGGIFRSAMKILEARPLSDFRLFLRFEDGTTGDVDLSSYAGRGVFSAWMEPGTFEQARVTSEGAVEWPGELDMCPDSLYLRLTGKAAEDLFSTLRLHFTHA